MRLLVTGASGFLGNVVCDELLERDHEVHALVRREGSEPPGTAAVAGDLTDSGSLSACRRIRRAGVRRPPRGRDRVAARPGEDRRGQCRGHPALIAACEAAGVRRIVFSSTVVTGDAKGALLDEETQLPVETEYGRSKQEGERLLRESSLEEVIIRPSHVYGPGGWFVEEFVNRLRQPGRFAVIGSGENWWDVVRVEDVASACADAAERAPAGALYHVVDDEPIHFYDFVALAATALGKGPPRRIPAWLARLVAGADPVRAVTRSAKSSNARIKSELGWVPRFPTARAGRARRDCTPGPNRSCMSDPRYALGAVAGRSPRSTSHAACSRPSSPTGSPPSISSPQQRAPARLRTKRRGDLEQQALHPPQQQRLGRQGHSAHLLP